MEPEAKTRVDRLRLARLTRAGYYSTIDPRTGRRQTIIVEVGKVPCRVDRVEALTHPLLRDLPTRAW